MSHDKMHIKFCEQFVIVYIGEGVIAHDKVGTQHTPIADNENKIYIFLKKKKLIFYFCKKIRRERLWGYPVGQFFYKW